MSRQHSIHYTVMNSPIGKMTVAATNKGICWISFDSAEASVMAIKRWGRTWLLCDHVVEAQTPLLMDAIQQFSEYFEGQRTEFNLPLDIYGTPFQKKVWEQLRLIPYGEVRTYKDIALGIGSAKSVRAVGGANNRNPLSIILPCHRVIGSNGALVGYGGGLEIKQYLLELESSLLIHSARKVQ